MLTFNEYGRLFADWSQVKLGDMPLMRLHSTLHLAP